MKIIFTIYLVFIFMNIILARMLANDFCKKIQNNCKQKENNLTNCEKRLYTCFGDYPFACRNEYCVKHRGVCDQFIQVNNLMRSFKSSYLYENDLKKLDSFKAQIKECSKYELKKDDFCYNKHSCYYMESYFISGAKKLVCPCVGKQKFHCGIDFCAVDSIACETLQSVEIQNKIKLNAIKKMTKKCHSFNLFQQRRLKFIF